MCTTLTFASETNTNTGPVLEATRFTIEYLSITYRSRYTFNLPEYHGINLTLTATHNRHAYTFRAAPETKQQRTTSETPHPQTLPAQHILRQPLPLVHSPSLRRKHPPDMGEPVEPTTQVPSPPAPTPSLPLLLLSKTALEASCTELIVLASVVLFLASQVCLLVWVLRRARCASPPAVSAHKKEEQRKVSIILPAETEPSPPATDDTHGDGASATGKSMDNSDSILRLRRSSTWSGRATTPGSRPRGRRKSAGPRRKDFNDNYDDRNEEDDAEEKQGAQTSLKLELKPDFEPKEGHGTLAAFGDMGRVAAALATPATLPLHSGRGSVEEGGDRDGGGAGDKETGDLDPQRAWAEASLLLGASIEKPRSPRSPRVLAADQAAMMDALCAEEEREGFKTAAPSPVGGIEEDPPALPLGFNDPLGVNRLVALPGEDDGEDAEEIELESRKGGRDL